MNELAKDPYGMAYTGIDFLKDNTTYGPPPFG